MSNLSLPTAEDSEKGFLCSFMRNPEGVNELCVFRKVSAEWFHSEDHRTIFLGLQEMLKLKKPFDLHTVTHFFEDRRKGFVLLDSNVAAKITEIYCHVETALNADYYLSRLQLTYAKRLGMISCRSAEQEFKSATEIQEVFNLSQKALLGVSEVCQEQEAVDHDRNDFMAFFQHMDDLATGAKKPDLFPSSIPALDDEAGGFCRGEVYVFKGLTSTGKSLLLQQVVQDNCHAGRKGMIFSAEMGHAQYMKRLVARYSRMRGSGVSLQSMRDARFNKAELECFSSAMMAHEPKKGVWECSIQGIKRNSMAPADIIRAIRMQKKNRGLDIVGIDYLQLLKFPPSDKRRDQELQAFSAELKRISEELDLVTLIVVQSNKDGGTFDGSQVESDADGVLNLCPVWGKIAGQLKVVGTDGIWVEKFREAKRGYKIPCEMEGKFCRLTYNKSEKKEDKF